jgi:Methyltransferase domain
MSATTLVFPVSTPEGRSYLNAALGRRERVVGASCDVRDPTGGAAPWRRLPLVHEPEFLDAFLPLVSEFGVTQIFAGAHMVHASLARLIREQKLADVRILNASPLEAECARWEAIFARAESWREVIAGLYPETTPPDPAFTAGVIRLAFDLFGESYDAKLAALLGALGAAPDGDIVEIGALFGRSASVLLAGRALGEAARRLFVFDPWCADAGAQSELPEALRAYTRATNFAVIVKAFEATFAALAPPGAMAAFRTASAAGHAWYEHGVAPASHRIAGSPIAPAGRIALLHIDGNHDYLRAAEDVALWSPLVAPGGWVAIDDYLWRYGDGPRRAGDELLAAWDEAAARAFVIGDCLFVQRAR